MFRSFFLLAVLAFGLMSVSVAEVFRWTDSRGRVVYGDDPPKSVKPETVDLPTLTIADSFKLKPTDEAQANVSNKKESDEPHEYGDFKIESPQSGDTLRANGGSVMIQVGLEGGLQEGDSIVLYVDGSQHSNGTEKSFQVTNMDRGSHSVFAVLRSADGELLKNTESVSFHVLRSSKHQRERLVAQ